MLKTSGQANVTDPVGEMVDTMARASKQPDPEDDVVEEVVGERI